MVWDFDIIWSWGSWHFIVISCQGGKHNSFKMVKKTQGAKSSQLRNTWKSIFSFALDSYSLLLTHQYNSDVWSFFRHFASRKGKCFWYNLIMEGYWQWQWQGTQNEKNWPRAGKLMPDGYCLTLWWSSEGEERSVSSLSYEFRVAPWWTPEILVLGKPQSTCEHTRSVNYSLNNWLNNCFNKKWREKRRR